VLPPFAPSLVVDASSVPVFASVLQASLLWFAIPPILVLYRIRRGWVAFRHSDFPFFGSDPGLVPTTPPLPFLCSCVFRCLFASRPSERRVPLCVHATQPITRSIGRDLSFSLTPPSQEPRVCPSRNEEVHSASQSDLFCNPP